MLNFKKLSFPKDKMSNLYFLIYIIFQIQQH